MGMVGHPKVPLDEVLNDRRTPAARGIACGLRPSFNQGREGLTLRFGQLRWSPWWALIDANWRYLATRNG